MTISMYTTSNLLTEVKRIAQLPDVSALYLSSPESEAWSDEGILLTGTNELLTRLVPEIVSMREDFFRFSKTYAVTSENQRLRIPSRAVGNKLVAVLWVSGTVLTPLEQVEADAGNDGQSGFYIDGAFVVMKGSDLSSGSVKLVFSARHGKLVSLTNSASVVSATSSSITVGAGLDSTTGWAYAIPAGTYDIVHGSSPYDYVSMDAALGAVNGVTHVCALTGSWDNTPAAGDYVFNQDETAFIQLPDDIFPVFCQRVACKVLDEIGDRDGYARARAELKDMESAIPLLSSPRVDKSPRKIFSKRLLGLR